MAWSTINWSAATTTIRALNMRGLIYCLLCLRAIGAVEAMAQNNTFRCGIEEVREGRSAQHIAGRTDSGRGFLQIRGAPGAYEKTRSRRSAAHRERCLPDRLDWQTDA